MVTLPNFFEINRDLFLFVYGLVFFVLGFGIIIRTRQSSRMELARSLRWLAAFGIIHGFNEWGDLFIPIQASYLSPPVLDALYSFQLILLTTSFGCILEFGVSLLRSLGRFKWLRGVSGALVLSWLVGIYVILPPIMLDQVERRNLAIAFSRYLIGFPGCLLAAYGLRAYTMERIAPLQVPVIVRTFKAAGHSIATYAILTGLIPPPIKLFPGNILNSNTFAQVIGIPPWVFRTIAAGVLTIVIIRAMEIFELESDRRIEELEQKQIIASERERYARKLHDVTIQKVYTAGLLVESASRLAKAGSKLDVRLGRAISVLNDTIVDLREELANLNSHAPIHPQPLAVLLEDLANNVHFKSIINISLDIELPDNKSLSPRRSNHIMAIVNEALANTVRHAQAKDVTIVARDLGNQFTIKINDNGIGLPVNPKVGYGLRNMRDRARLLNSKIEFSNKKGTSITLEIPWQDNKLI